MWPAIRFSFTKVCLYVNPPSYITNYARLSSNTLCLRKNQGRDHRGTLGCFNYILKPKYNLYSKHPKDSNVEFPFSLFLDRFCLLLLWLYEVLCWLHLFLELFLILKLFSGCNKVKRVGNTISQFQTFNKTISWIWEDWTWSPSLSVSHVLIKYLWPVKCEVNA